MSRSPTAVHAPPETSPWGQARERWNGFRDRHRLGWPRAPVVNWTLALLVAVIVAVAAFLAWFNWDRLRGPIARYASATTGRSIRIDGHLHVHLWSWTPSATLDGLRIGNPRWAGPGDTADIGRSTIVVRLIPLLFGHVEIMELQLDHPVLDLVKDKDGRVNWNLSRNPNTHARPLQLHTLVVRAGQVRYRDEKTRQSLLGRFASSDRDDPKAAQGFHFAGTANLHGRPFQLTISGGPIIKVQRDRPYRFNAEVRGDSSHVVARGQLDRPFDLNRVSGRLDVSGADLADLYFLTGLAMPDTPTYSLSGEFTRDHRRYAIRNMTGRVGDSDLNGRISVDSRRGRPDLTADLRSRNLVFEDLAALFGGGTRKASASPAQKAVAAKMQAERRLLPDSTLDLSRVRAMDADVRYRADSVRARFLPLRRIALHLKLDHGLLVIDPVTAELTRGTISGRAAINARSNVPGVDIDMRASNVRIEDFMAKAGAEPAISGAVLARVKLSGHGASVHAAASNANGGVTFVVPHGEIRKAFAELSGINAIKGLMLLWSKNQDRTDVRCAVAHFDVSNGIMRSRRMVFDTAPVRIDGGGTINLASETLDLKVQGHPKKFRIGHLNAPVDVKGKLLAPHYSVETGKIVAQGGIAAGLGVVLSPLAAILPFVDPGLAKNADCSGLMAEQAQVKAPVAAHSARRR